MNKIILYIIILFAFSSCKVLFPYDMLRVQKGYEFKKTETIESEYKIEPFDMLSIQMLTNEGYSTMMAQGVGESNEGLQVMVESDGTAKLPILGRIKVTGFTLREIEELFEKEFSEYYQKPYVTVKITNRRVIIFSEAGSSASILHLTEEDMTLVEAIANIGGLSLNSKSYRIRLIRGELNNNPDVYLFNIYNLSDLQNVNLTLMSNDIIYIESKPRYVSRALGEISPYLSLISTLLLIYTLFSR